MGPNYNMIAELCHNVNKAYCEYMGDFSQLDWDDESEAMVGIRKSAIDGVIFHFTNDTTPEESHENWMEFKLKEGWVYGEVKDLEKKTHPCLVPYDQLPEDQQVKDHLFTAIVTTFKKMYEPVEIPEPIIDHRTARK